MTTEALRRLTTLVRLRIRECQAPGLVESLKSRADGCRRGGAVGVGRVVGGLELGWWDQPDLAVQAAVVGTGPGLVDT